MWDHALKPGPVWTVQPEISTHFPLLAQNQARARTEMSGDPVICSTSNLLPGKRPQLMLDAFEALLPHWPKAHLYLCYRFDDMLPALRARLAHAPALAQAVTLMGHVPRDQMADLYNSADIYLLTSKHEIGPTSFTEAAACGAIPVCTDLASIRKMSDAGKIGILFPLEASGDEIAQAMLPLRNQISDQNRADIRAYFETYLSYDKIVGGMVAQWAQPRRT